MKKLVILLLLSIILFGLYPVEEEVIIIKHEDLEVNPYKGRIDGEIVGMQLAYCYYFYYYQMPNSDKYLIRKPIFYQYLGFVYSYSSIRVTHKEI